MAGPAFNPWRPASGGWVSAVPMAQNPRHPTANAPAYVPPAYVPSYAGNNAGAYDRGSYLPSPPPNALESRLVAIPERGDEPGARRSVVAPPLPPVSPVPETPVSTVTVAPPPTTPAPVPVTRAEPPPAPVSPAPAPAATTVATPASPPPAAAPAATPAPAAAVQATPLPPPATAAAPVPPPEPKSTRPGPNEPREAPPSRGTPAVSVTFGSNSAEISDVAKADLDRVAKTISQQRMSQVELRAFAGGPDPAEARKVALARALAVRSYLIDQGVKARIEVGAFSATRNTSGGERVDVLAPGP
jgi:outer membrane protein OmpA-like peptidoglycan-associated protein